MNRVVSRISLLSSVLLVCVLAAFSAGCGAPTLESQISRYKTISDKLDLLLVQTDAPPPDQAIPVVAWDLDYRSELWKWSRKEGDVMPDMVRYCDVAVGNEEDAEKVFGIRAPGADVDGGKADAEAYRHVAEAQIGRAHV